MVGGEHSLKISALYFSWFGCNDVLKVCRKSALSNFMSDRGVCITAQATPGLLNISGNFSEKLIVCNLKTTYIEYSQEVRRTHR